MGACQNPVKVGNFGGFVSCAASTGELTKEDLLLLFVANDDDGAS
jgi:hypothetical protein